ncbi:MAG: hypothetical protein Q9160_004362 [Pyrenula sp. 1 TL-2023]
MGNSQGKESRQGQSIHNRGRASSFSPPLQSPRGDPGSDGNGFDRPPAAVYSSRGGRGSRHDLSFLGLGSGGDRDVSSLEQRRETKQEREARKLEKERTARLQERERSMKEEHVDGGFLVTQGVYVGVEDFNKKIVRHLMIDRRLAPFWRGLNDYSESWAEHQLIAAGRGLPIPPADQVPPELEYRAPSNTSDEPKSSSKNLKNLTVPISSRSQSYNSDSSNNLSPALPAFSMPSPSSPIASPSSNTPLFRTRAKTLASLTTSSKNSSQNDMVPREVQLPHDPFVNGQPIEVHLYKDASECPICFIYYPAYLNTTRCCDQPICSECFVQIKRPDPHPPEHEQPDPNAPPLSEADRLAMSDGQLVSEVATCPFCKQPEFGITYSPPPYRRGLAYAPGPQQLANVSSAMSSQTSLSSGAQSPGAGRRRGTSLSATAPGVITTDRIRPDWATKLASARAHAARRSAAATALHTAAYLIGGGSSQGQDTRGFGGFGRRSMLRRPTGDSSDNPGTSSPHLNALAFLAERHARQRDDSSQGPDGPQVSPFLPPPRGSSSRQSRMDDLEEMMMMEAIRLSLAAEEERRKKEEKEAKKEAKKKEKENKKAEKAAKKNAPYQTSPNTSGTLEGARPSYIAQNQSASSLGEDSTLQGKGKGIDRSETPPALISDSCSEPPSASLPGISLPGSGDSPPWSAPPTGSEPLKKSHLRQISNASSSTSSLVDPNAGQGASNSEAGLEPMFNFRSLAAVIGDEENEKTGGEDVMHIESTTHQPETNHEHDTRNENGKVVSPEQSAPNLGALEEKKGKDGDNQETRSDARDFAAIESKP